MIGGLSRHARSTEKTRLRQQETLAFLTQSAVEYFGKFSYKYIFHVYFTVVSCSPILLLLILEQALMNFQS